MIKKLLIRVTFVSDDDLFSPFKIIILVKGIEIFINSVVRFSGHGLLLLNFFSRLLLLVVSLRLLIDALHKGYQWTILSKLVEEGFRFIT